MLPIVTMVKLYCNTILRSYFDALFGTTVHRAKSLRKSKQEKTDQTEAEGHKDIESESAEQQDDKNRDGI